MTPTSGNACLRPVDAGAGGGLSIDFLAERLDGDEETTALELEVALAFIDGTRGLLQQLDDANLDSPLETI